MKPTLIALAFASLFVAHAALAEMPGSGTYPCQAYTTVGGPGIERRSYALEPYESCFTYDGAVVVVKDPSLDAHDPSNWSDVLIFYEPGAPWQGGYAIEVGYLSEQSIPGGIGGIQDADFEALFHNLSVFS